jgi:hypothetical protein
MHMAVNPPSSGYEREDASVRAIILTGAALAIGSVIVALIVYGIFWYFAHHPLSTAVENPMELANPEARRPPAPRIEEHPADEVQQLRRQEDLILGTYGWTDKDAGVARIPIDRAMDLALQRGLPSSAGGKK